MANENKDTKRNLLIELESIQGLLGEDDIPVLQEVIDELDEHREGNEAPEHPAANALTEKDLEQLKSAYRALTDERGDSLPETPSRNDEPQAPSGPAAEIEGTLPGQQGLFDEPGAEEDAEVDTTEPEDDPEPEIDSKPRLQGENPFLPQHIRERLRGNRAGDFPPVEPRLKTRKELVDELVSELTPRIESALRLKLAAMTEQELAALSDNPTQAEDE